MKILSISAEVAPFAKTGGLADVCGALPKYMRNLGHDVRVVMPAYQKIEHEYHTTNKYGLEALPGQLWVPTGASVLPAGALHGTLPGSDVPIYFIAEWNMFGRSEIYGYSDDAYRFAFFAKAVAELILAMDWKPDIIHAHDWHAAPFITWLATAGSVDERFRGIPTVFTIHNLAHQGRTHWRIFDYMGIQTYALREEGYDEVNFMARGIQHATMINTVSPTYAREIMTPELGAHVDKLLHTRAFDVHGILNGIDTDVWNPATDPHIAHRFDADTLDGKIFNKRDLQARVGLPQRDDVPLVAMVSRLDFQKGLDLMGHALHLLLNNYAGGDAQFIVLGTGADEYEQMFMRLAQYHKDKMRAYLTYDAMLSQMIYAGADMFLMPSRFEPCGLGQMIAMRYGTVPVVRATGGLADTVFDGYTGFSFYDYNVDAFWGALNRAVQTFHRNPSHWREIQQNGMRQDLSWETSAKRYAEIYAWAIARAGGGNHNLTNKMETLSNSQIVLIILGLIYLMVLGIWFRSAFLIYRGLSSKKWKKAKGKIIEIRLKREIRSRRVVFKNSNFKFPEITFEYDVNGIQYTSKNTSFSPFYPVAFKITKNFTQNSQVDIYYNPLKPKLSVLRPGFTPIESVYMSMVFGATSFVIGLSIWMIIQSII